MSSREIVERLINEHIINGEEAFTLINDICKNEMYDVWKTLEGSKITYNPTIWTGTSSTPYTISTSSGNATTGASSYTVKSV